MNPPPSDPVIEEIREIRHQISARFDHDPAKLVAHLIQFQQQFRDRLTYDPAEATPVAPLIPQGSDEAA